MKVPKEKERLEFLARKLKSDERWLKEIEKYERSQAPREYRRVGRREYDDQQGESIHKGQ